MAALKAKIDANVARLGAKDAQAAIEALAENAKEAGAAPFLLAAFPQILEATGNKSKAVATAAVAVAHTVVEVAGPYAGEQLLPAFLQGLGVKAKPAQKEATCNVITGLAERSPASIGYLLVRLVSPVADLTCDIKKEVKPLRLHA